MKLKPTRLSFGKISRTDGPHVKTVAISRGDGGPIAPELEPIKGQVVTAEVREIEPGEKYELEVTLVPPFKSNRVHQRLTLKTGIPQAPATLIQVYASLDPLVTAYPQRVLVPRERDSEWTTTVRLTWTDGSSTHKVVSATVNDPDLKVEPDPDDPLQVLLNVPADWDLKRGSRTLMIKTDDEAAPSVRVHVRMGGKNRPRTSSAQDKAGRKLRAEHGTEKKRPPQQE